MPESHVLLTKTDDKNRAFNLNGNIEFLVLGLERFINGSDTDEEMTLDYINSINTPELNETTQDERNTDITTMKDLINKIDNTDTEWLSTWFSRIPRKKNGTFHKGRVVSINRFHSYETHDEEAYGTRGPELIIRTTDDFNAELLLEDRIEKF